MYFTKTNAKVLKGDAIDTRIVNLIVNPDLTKVSGIVPHHWIFKDGEIVSMNAEEISHRENLINEVGVINEPTRLDDIADKVAQAADVIMERQESKKFDIKTLIIVSLISVAVSLIMFIIGSKYV